MKENHVPHPVGLMSEPTEQDIQRSVVALSWHLREYLGASERLLDSMKSVSVELAEATLPRLSAYAGGAIGLAGFLNVTWSEDEGDAAAVWGAADLLTISAHHCEAAICHLRNHVAYNRLLLRPQGVPHERLASLGSKEREYAARALQASRQSAHRALARLVEFWPTAFDKEDDGC